VLVPFECSQPVQAIIQYGIATPPQATQQTSTRRMRVAA
jgi:hypothetical protein